MVTLSLDAEAQERFDAERARLFPPGRTEIGAHVTLFHAVPGELADEVCADLAAHAGPAFDVRVTDVVLLGRGVAYALESQELSARHRLLQRRWHDHLTAQDRQGFRPHITVQNKVAPEQARQTASALREVFRPHDVRAIGFALWRYDGGPWTHLRTFEFADGTADHETCD